MPYSVAIDEGRKSAVWLGFLGKSEEHVVVPVKDGEHGWKAPSIWNSATRRRSYPCNTRFASRGMGGLS
jgi:hypothetical protein